MIMLLSLNYVYVIDFTLCSSYKVYIMFMLLSLHVKNLMKFIL